MAEPITELTTGPNLVTLSDARRPLGDARSPRRLVALAILAPLVLWALLADAEAGTHPLWALVLLSLGAGVALASYVPLRGQTWRDVLWSPCATFGGVLPLGCAASVLSRSGSGTLVIAGGFVVFALYQRLGDGGACRT